MTSLGWRGCIGVGWGVAGCSGCSCCSARRISPPQHDCTAVSTSSPPASHPLVSSRLPTHPLLHFWMADVPAPPTRCLRAAGQAAAERFGFSLSQAWVWGSIGFGFATAFAYSSLGALVLTVLRTPSPRPTGGHGGRAGAALACWPRPDRSMLLPSRLLPPTCWCRWLCCHCGYCLLSAVLGCIRVVCLPPSTHLHYALLSSYCLQWLRRRRQRQGLSAAYLPSCGSNRGPRCMSLGSRTHTAPAAKCRQSRSWAQQQLMGLASLERQRRQQQRQRRGQGQRRRQQGQQRHPSCPSPSSVETYGEPAACQGGGMGELPGGSMHCQAGQHKPALPQLMEEQQVAVPTNLWSCGLPLLGNPWKATRHKHLPACGFTAAAGTTLTCASLQALLLPEGPLPKGGRQPLHRTQMWLASCSCCG